MKIQLLLTGDELMAGHTVDSNSAMIAEALSEFGYIIDKKVTIGDDLQKLVDEIRNLSNEADVLIINGGLGPTVDDLTAEALAEASGDSLVENPNALQHLQQWCDDRNLSLNAANHKQAILPSLAKIIHNPIGSAVGFSINYNNCLITCTPGVPSELKAILADSLTRIIREQLPHYQQQTVRRLQTFGIGESTLQQLFNEKLPDWPKTIELGFRAGFPLLEVKLSTKLPANDPLLDEWQEKLEDLLSNELIGHGQISLPECLIKLLIEQGKTLTTAESCTGGLIAAMLTETAGASCCFHAGIVSYSNSMKTQLLGVSKETLENHGAVSQEVVTEMFAGALKISQADYAIAVSGIAGPDGGSTEKPVGTVWIAWGHKDNIHTHKMQINGSRKWFQKMVASCCLDLIRRELQAISTEPRYFGRY